MERDKRISFEELKATNNLFDKATKQFEAAGERAGTNQGPTHLSIENPLHIEEYVSRANRVGEIRKGIATQTLPLLQEKKERMEKELNERLLRLQEAFSQARQLRDEGYIKEEELKKIEEEVNKYLPSAIQDPMEKSIPSTLSQSILKEPIHKESTITQPEIVLPDGKTIEIPEKLLPVAEKILETFPDNPIPGSDICLSVWGLVNPTYRSKLSLQVTELREYFLVQNGYTIETIRPARKENRKHGYLLKEIPDKETERSPLPETPSSPTVDENKQTSTDTSQIKEERTTTPQSSPTTNEDVSMVRTGQAAMRLSMSPPRSRLEVRRKITPPKGPELPSLDLRLSVLRFVIDRPNVNENSIIRAFGGRVETYPKAVKYLIKTVRDLLRKDGQSQGRAEIEMLRRIDTFMKKGNIHSLEEFEIWLMRGREQAQHKEKTEVVVEESVSIPILQRKEDNGNGLFEHTTQVGEYHPPALVEIKPKTGYEIEKRDPLTRENICKILEEMQRQSPAMVRFSVQQMYVLFRVREKFIRSLEEDVGQIRRAGIRKDGRHPYFDRKTTAKIIYLWRHIGKKQRLTNKQSQELDKIVQEETSALELAMSQTSSE